MAGGRGTRISSVAADIPKPMIKIAGMPVLEHQLACLARQGFTDVIITVSHLADVIMNYFGDGSGISPITGKPFGVHITYFKEDEPLGNAGALFRLREQLTGDFLLLNADALFDVDLTRFVAYHREKGGLATLFVHPNSHPYDSALIVTDGDGCVERWLTREEPRPAFYHNCVNAGLHVLSPRLLEGPMPLGKVDLDRGILKPLAGTGEMFAYQSPEYVKDMGTPERYAAVEADFLRGTVQQKNLQAPQRAVFLDRDGTLNRYVGFLRDIKDFSLLDGVAEAVRRINASGYLAIVVTNQPVVARGEVSAQELDMIHCKMETLLGAQGAYLDAVYYCPHHPHKGYAGEVAALKIECDCRKPKPGLLLRAARDFHIDLAASFMVGDSEADILAGKAAGCKTVLLGEGDFLQDRTCASLLDFVKELTV